MMPEGPPQQPEWVLSKKHGVKEKGYENPNWGMQENPNVGGHLIYLHTCTFDLHDLQIKAMPGSKEFGEGFYTTGNDSGEAYKIIAEDWFEVKQTRYDWHVIAFALPADLVLRKLCGKGNEALHVPLRFYLENSTGYRLGGKNPNAKDLEEINAINRVNRVLILPHNKDTKVAFGPGKETKSWRDFTAGKTGGGDYRLVIGPQQPTNLEMYRQYAWTTGWGVWLINSGIRYYKYRNYNIKENRRVTNGRWPTAKSKTITNNSKSGEKKSVGKK